MANNEHINKVVKSTGETLIDLTNDTVTAETLLKDVTAHDRSGAQIEGAVIVAPTDVTQTEDNEAYLYKSSEHDAVYDELVGGSVAWNQLIGASWDSLNKTEGTTFAQNSDGTLHISGTGSGLHFCNSEIVGGLVNGHKYLYSIAGMKAGITSQIYSTTSGSARYIVTSTTNSIGIFTHTAQASDISQFARFYTDTSYSGTTDLKYILIDLTRMFGTTIADYVYNLEQSTEGSGIAWLKSYGFFIKDYYAYNAGGLVSVNTSGKKVVDENAEITYPIQPADLRGLYKLNGNKLYTDGDIYSADGQITRKYGYRGYQSGDESLANAITDGTHTIYKLSAPTTETAQPFTSPQMVYRNGTEEYLDTRDVPMPVGGNRKYVDIPDWMVNEYFDDMRAGSSIIDEIKKEADTLEEHLKAFIIESNIGDPTRINNTSDFTVELFDKIWGTNTDLYPRFAHLFLFGNEAHFLKAIIESIVVNTYTPTYTSEKLIQATFISEMSMYYFRWVRGQAPSMNKYTISVT